MHIQTKVYYVALLMFVGTAFIACQRSNSNSTTTVTTPAPADSAAVTDGVATTPDSLAAPVNMPPPLPIDSSLQTNFSFVLLSHDDGTLGYEVFESGKLVISQPYVPGSQGKKGFATKEQAAAAATLVIDKLEQGITPPTISEKELKKILKE